MESRRFHSEDSEIPPPGVVECRGATAEWLLGHPEKTLCFCMGVTAGEVRDAVLGLERPSLAELHRSCPAGTDCGSCRPEIRRLIRELLGREAEP